MDNILPVSLEIENSQSARWSAAAKIAFRFFFVFLGVQTLVAYNSFFTVTGFTFYSTLQMLEFFNGPVHWIDLHFFHFGYDPDQDASFFGDLVFGWLFLILLFFLSLIATLIWSLADRKRMNYNKLHYWFRVYLSYYLFIALVLYAVVKIIPTQMPYPNIDTLEKPLGELNGFGLLWTFIGARPGYAMFTGVCEMIGALLVLSRRTRVFGTLFLATVLINVVLLNVFYNVMVKLPSMHLLAIDLFLMAPSLPGLFRFFYLHEAISIGEKRYVFKSPWKKYLMIILLLAPAWATYKAMTDAWGRYKQGDLLLKSQHLYRVTLFTERNDSLPARMNDSLAWTKFTVTSFLDQSYATVYTITDKHLQFRYSVDSSKHTIKLDRQSGNINSYEFHYENHGPDQYILTGEWMDMPVRIVMKPLSIDSMRLNKEKINWIVRPN